MTYDNNSQSGWGVQQPYSPPATPPAKKKTTFVVVLILVVSVALIVGAVIFRVHQDSSPVYLPAPCCTGPSSTSPQPSPTNSEDAPCCAGPSSSSASSSGDFFAFFDPPVHRTDDPDQTAYEASTQQTIKQYAQTLVLFANMDLTTYVDPMVGEWRSDVGYFVFTGTEFYWYQGDTPNPDGNYYRGVYEGLPACQLNSGYEQYQNGHPCFSIFLRYGETHRDGEIFYDTYYGLFMLSQYSPDVLDVTNQRTGSSFTLNRA